jgi:hypothetical protein
VAVRRVLSRGQRALIHGRDRLAAALEPGEELAERAWAYLRDPTAGLTVPWQIDDPPIFIAGAFTARRFAVTTADGRQVWVTEVSVAVRFVPDPGMTGDEVELAEERLLDGVDAVWNYQHVLEDGSQFHYQIEFTDDPHAAQQTVRLHRGDRPLPGQPPTSYRDFYLDMQVPTWAHEAGHWLGLLDRYQDSRFVSRKQPVSPGVRHDVGVMSAPHAWWANGSSLKLRPGVSQGPSLEVGLFYGLKDDDLDRVHGLIQQAERNAAPEGDAGIWEVTGEARAPKPSEVVFRAAGLPDLADVLVPGHVTRMLAMLSPGERTLETALLLDYGRVLLGQEPADAEEARYLVGLVLLAGDVYGGVTFYWFTRRVDEPLGWLVRFLGRVTGAAEPDRYLPGHGELRRLVAELLGLPPSFEVTAAEVDAAAHAVVRYRKEMPRLPDSKPDLDEFARTQLPPHMREEAGDVLRAYGRLLQFEDELDLGFNLDGSRRADRPGLEVAAQVDALVREAAGSAGPEGPVFRPDLEPVLDRLFGRLDLEKVWEKDQELDDRRLRDLRLQALLWLVGLSLEGGGRPGPASLGSLEVLTGQLLGETAPQERGTALQERLAGIERLRDLADALLPGAGMSRQQWLDLALVSGALRAEQGLEPATGLSAVDLADFVRWQAGDGDGQGGTLIPELLAVAAQRLRSRPGSAAVQPQARWAGRAAGRVLPRPGSGLG